jgi:hypothetical protein
MSKSKKVSITELLLVPAKRNFRGDSCSNYRSAGLFNSRNGKTSTKVYVMRFNCKRIEEIPKLIKLEIHNLASYFANNPEVKDIVSQVEFFINLNEELEDLSLRQNPPEKLMDFLEGKGFFGINKENVIFISGVPPFLEE